LVHISDNIVYFASYFREDCVYRFIFQTILYIFLNISEKIVYFASYFRHDCVFCFILQTRLCILLHISDKIVYLVSVLSTSIAMLGILTVIGVYLILMKSE